MKIENMLQRFSCISFLFKPLWEEPVYRISKIWINETLRAVFRVRSLIWVQNISFIAFKKCCEIGYNWIFQIITGYYNWKFLISVLLPLVVFLFCFLFLFACLFSLELKTIQVHNSLTVPGNSLALKFW